MGKINYILSKDGKLYYTEKDVIMHGDKSKSSDYLMHARAKRTIPEFLKDLFTEPIWKAIDPEGYDRWKKNHKKVTKEDLRKSFEDHWNNPTDAFTKWIKNVDNTLHMPIKDWFK